MKKAYNEQKHTCTKGKKPCMDAYLPPPMVSTKLSQKHVQHNPDFGIDSDDLEVQTLRINIRI